jgi:putative ABC transport system permease protein
MHGSDHLAFLRGVRSGARAAWARGGIPSGEWHIGCCLIARLGGGLVEVALGIGIAMLLARELHWPTIIRAGTILLSMGFSALVGRVLGHDPAQEASRLDSLDALRLE